MITTSRTMRHGLGAYAEPAVRSHRITEERTPLPWRILFIAALVMISLAVGVHLS